MLIIYYHSKWGLILSHNLDFPVYEEEIVIPPYKIGVGRTRDGAGTIGRLEMV